MQQRTKWHRNPQSDVLLRDLQVQARQTVAAWPPDARREVGAPLLRALSAATSGEGDPHSTFCRVRTWLVMAYRRGLLDRAPFSDLLFMATAIEGTLPGRPVGVRPPGAPEGQDTAGSKRARNQPPSKAALASL